MVPTAPTLGLIAGALLSAMLAITIYSRFVPDFIDRHAAHRLGARRGPSQPFLFG